MKTRTKIVLGIAGLYALKKAIDIRSGVGGPNDEGPPESVIVISFAALMLFAYWMFGSPIMGEYIGASIRAEKCIRLSIVTMTINFLLIYILRLTFPDDRHDIHHWTETWNHTKNFMTSSYLIALIATPIYFVFCIDFLGIYLFGLHFPNGSIHSPKFYGIWFETRGLIAFTLLACPLPLIVTLNIYGYYCPKAIHALKQKDA